MKWAGKYIGLPFVDHGRDFAGVDCWGLVRLVLKHECDIDVPDYGEISALDLQAVAGVVAKQKEIEPWVHVHPNAVNPFDVAVMHRRRDPIHVGIMITRFEVLHIEEHTAAVMVPIEHHSVKFRYPKFYRHRELIKRAA